MNDFDKLKTYLGEIIHAKTPDKKKSKASVLESIDHVKDVIKSMQRYIMDDSIDERLYQSGRKKVAPVLGAVSMQLKNLSVVIGMHMVLSDLIDKIS